jgi:hypothetical protein
LGGCALVKWKKELLFVNKKKQKNFMSFSAGMFQRRAKRSKSFLVLFFKKELLAFAYLGLFAKMAEGASLFRPTGPGE